MTTSQLRQWSLKNSQPDQWWLCLDGVTDEIPVTVAKIEERLKAGEFSKGQILHVSQAEMANPPWIDVTMTAALNVPASNHYPAVPYAELQATGVSNALTKAKPSRRVQDFQLREIASIVGIVFAIAFFLFLLLFLLKAVPYLMIFLLTWIMMGVILQKMAQSAVLTFGGGLIVAAIIFLVTAKTFPNLGSDSENSSAHNRVERSEAVSSKKIAFGEHTISGDNFTGFSRLEDDQRAAELAGDTEAFSKFFLAGVMTKRATLFKRGETVILEDAEGLLSSKVKLRRKGEAVSYWTNRESID